MELGEPAARMHPDRLAAPAAELSSIYAWTMFRGVAKSLAPRNFRLWCATIYGADIPAHAYDTLRARLRDGSLSNPSIVVNGGRFRGHYAGYRKKEHAHEIWIARSLPDLAARGDVHFNWKLLTALCEEFGHYVDDLLRFHYSNVGLVAPDAVRDEGAVFASQVLYFAPGERDRTHYATYTTDEGACDLHVEYKKYAALYRFLIGPDEQEEDGADADFEFFGAGRGSGAHAFGHQSIEDALSPHFDKRQRLHIYFGNWLRDYSQVCVRLLMKKPGVGFSTDYLGFSRGTLTRVVGLLAQLEFGDPHQLGQVKGFEVTEATLGVYLPEEHIDNPRGLTNGKDIDPDLPGAWSVESCAIDPVFRTKKFIRTPVPGCTSALGHIYQRLNAAMTAGPTLVGYREFGAALHTLEDYFAHSNFIELALISLGWTKVVPWTSMDDGVYPVVTGVFGGLDTAASILHTLSEHLRQPGGGDGYPFKTRLIAILAEDLFPPKWLDEVNGVLDGADKISKAINQGLRSIPYVGPAMSETLEKAGEYLATRLAFVVDQLADGIKRAQDELNLQPSSTDPTHTQLAKDGPDHPLHELAAECSKIVVSEMGARMKNAWWPGPGLPPMHSPAVTVLANIVLIHPRDLTIASAGPMGEVLRTIQVWAMNPSNAEKLKRACSRSHLLADAEARLTELQDLLRSMSSRRFGDPDKLRERLKELGAEIAEPAVSPTPSS